MGFPKIADRVKDTTTTATNGTITLANSAPSGFRTFGSAFSNLDVVYYCIAHQTANEWEIRIGTYTSSGTTLSVDQVIANSDGNTTPHTFSAGTKDVFSVDPACANAGNAIFGSGVDGAVTYDGIATILGMAPSSNVYTLTRDIHCTSIVVNNAITVITANYRIFCNGVLLNNGTIHNNGNNAITTTGGAVRANGSLKDSNVPGGNGLTVAGNGTNPQALSGAYGGAGGNGGIDNQGHSAGGGGGVNAPGPGLGAVYQYLNAVAFAGVSGSNGTIQSYICGGSGGGGAFSTGTSSGAGGKGGGPVLLVCKIIINNGTISSNGGNGSNAVQNAGVGNAAGGGGAGGGIIIVIYNNYFGSIPVALAGTHGNGVGTGTNGNDGSTGLIVLLLNA